MKKRNLHIVFPILPFRCPIWYLFLKCTQASSFWVDFQDWFSYPKEKNLQLSNLDILYCTFHSSCHYLALNHLLIIGSTFHTLMPMLKTNFSTTTLYLSSQLNRANKINTEESGISYKIFYLILAAMYFSLCCITIQLWKPKMISCNFWLCFNRGCNVYLVTYY